MQLIFKPFECNLTINILLMIRDVLEKHSVVPPMDRANNHRSDESSATAAFVLQDCAQHDCMDAGDRAKQEARAEGCCAQAPRDGFTAGLEEGTALIRNLSC